MSSTNADVRTAFASKVSNEDFVLATSLSIRGFRWSLVLLLILAVQPISSRDFWWQLSSAFPWTAECGEPYWLGGTCLRWIFDWGGIHSLMLLKVVTALILATWWNRRIARPTQDDASLQDSGWLGLGLLAVHGSQYSMSTLWDALGMACVWQFAARPGLRRLDLLGLFVVMLIWTNSSPGVVLGLFFIGLWRGQRRTSFFALMSLLLLVICLSPRGWRAGIDSFYHLFPMCLAGPEVLCRTEWAPTIFAEWNIGTFGLLLLTIATSPVLWRATEFRFILMWGLLVTAGWCSQSNVAPTAIGLACLGQSHSTPVVAAVIAWFHKYQKLRHVILAAVCIWLATGLGFSTRFGWGLASELDLTAFGALVRTERTPGKVIGFDRGTLGAARWLKRTGSWPSSAVEDSPQRALVEGRLRKWVQLRDDLALGKLHPYRRSDGTSGGWWQVLFPASLTQRRPHLLMVAATDTELIRALEPTLWKPLLLDAPIIPYALADEVSFSKEIITTIKLREISNRGAWQPSLVSAGVNRTYVDLWGLLIQSPDINESLRLARTLRAMQLPNAAAKVLFSCRPPINQRAWTEELAGCWWDQAAEEALRAGSSSHFFDPAGIWRDGPKWLSNAPSNAPSYADFESSIFKRIQNNELLTPSSPSPEEQLYAEARIALLQGQPDAARERFQALVRDHPTSAVAALARWELE